MREILFRGKSVDNSEWVYGYFVHQYGADEIYLPEPDEDGFESRHIDPETLGQGVGITDKNGKQIFEGDIVEFFGMRGVITQASGAFGIMCSKIIDYDILESKLPFKNAAYFCYNDYFITLWELYWNYEQDDYLLSEVEIIGNIHDNPELLKENEEV